MIKITPFRDQPLKQKLSAIILLTSSILVLLATTAVAISDLLSYRRNLITEVFTLADLIGLNSSAALLYDVPATAIENMAGLRANPHIITAHLFTAADETVFASYFREAGTSEAQTVASKTLNEIYPSSQTPVEHGSRPDNFFFRGHHLEVFKQIRFKNHLLGIVYIQSDLTALTERLWWTGGILVTVLFISLLLGLLIARKLQQLVTTPIYHLLHIMDTVSTQNNYSLRAQKPGNDELGKLVDGFNQMLGQIQDYREHLEDKVKQRTVELAKARDQALAANKAKSVFLANISHEIRTPLNAVLGYAQLLQYDTNLTAAQYESLQIIEHSGDHLLELINDILDLSKIEAGATELRNESFSLCQLLQEVAAMFKGTCEQKQLVWRVDTQLPNDQIVSGDPGKLRQILINLVGNAVKFTHAGEVVLQITPSSNDVYQFEVRDTGPGISPESLENIFKPFYQDTAGIAQGGTGLGLTISKQQVELMGGTLTVTSTLGKGSSFTVSLPLPSSQDTITVENASPKHFRLAPNCHVTALVAEAQKDQRVMLTAMLRQIGVEVYEAVSGPECLEDLQTQPTQIAFLSMQLPLLSSVDVVERLRGDGASPTLPCVAIVNSPPQGKQVLSLGFQDFLLTPFRFETLHHCLNQWVPGIEFEDLTAQTLERANLTGPAECVPATVSAPQKPLGEKVGWNPQPTDVLPLPPKPSPLESLVSIDVVVDLTGAKILMVDDTPENLEVLRKVLVKDHYQVWFANSGEMAIQLTHQILPDLILLDVMMPVMDGFETCHRLKQQEATKNIPVIFITAKHQTEDVVEGFSKGAVDFVNKPFKQEEVRMRVRNHLQLYLWLQQRERILQLADQARLAAEASNRAKSTFLANLSHELRTPLNGILGYAQILNRAPELTRQQQEGISVIQRSGEYLLTLLTDILDLAKMETGHVKLLETEFNFYHFLRNLTSLFQIRAELKGISFAYQPFSPLPLGVRGDEKRLRQVLVNLLGNAVKFTHRGGVTLKVGYGEDFPPNLSLNQSPKSHLRFLVEDTGIGIAKAELEHIRLPFQQGGDPQFRPDGTGVGLTIAHNLIKLMGGDLQIESTLGQGSHFWFDLHLPEVPHWIEQHEANQKVITGYHGPSRHLLVVDDHWENRAIIRDLLKPLGFEVTEAQQGQEGLKQIRARRPDLVITDLVMPVMDGFELIRQVRYSPDFQDLPILVFSASVLEEEVPTTGYQAFLTKPFQADRLLELLRVHLGLTWNYGDSSSPQTPVAPIEPIPATEKLPEIMVGPSPEQAAILAKLAMMGDISGVVEELANFHQANPQLEAFTQHLNSLAKEYEMNKIEELIKRFL